MKRVALALALAAVFVAPAAFAEDAQPATKDQKPTHFYVMKDTIIVGRPAKPAAAVDVNKIQPKLTLTDLRQPFLDRIEEAAKKDPF